MGGVRGADASTLALVVEQQDAHSLGVRSVAFSPDGTTIVSSSTDRSIKLWGERRSLALRWRELSAVDGRIGKS